MENINELLTSEQMDMLIHDLGYSDIVALFLMNEDDKYRYFAEKFNFYSNKHSEYVSKYNLISGHYLELKAAHKPEGFSYLDLQDSCFQYVDRFYNFMKIYEILLTHV